MPRVVVCGAGIFGASAALALRARRYDVTLLDAGRALHPSTETIDINKAVRMDYGADEAYTAMMEEALDGWRAWNAAWETPLFHETGVTYLSRAPMVPGGFEHDSWQVLTRRGHALERLDAAAIRARFPAWSTGAYVDGYFNPAGGYAESGKVLARVLDEARAEGVHVEGAFHAARLVERGARVVAVEAADGARVAADHVVVASGAWATRLVPELAGHLVPAAQPVFCLRPADPRPFLADLFPTFGADIAKTGYYGFPYLPHTGWVKIANHGPGRALDPEKTHAPSREDEAALRAFLRGTFPALETAEIAASRMCIYCDTRDEHFWIAPDPARENLVVAAGGSGHAFKFAPLLGRWVADAVEGTVIPRFRWRTDAPARGEEAARFHG